MSVILIFASLLAAIIPMFIYLLLIWWMDRNEREPLWLMLLNFGWGATGAIFLAIIGSLIFQIPLSTLISNSYDGNAEELISLSGAVVTAPIVEEFTKGIFLMIMASTRRFDGIVDGVVYGGAIGLGFGMTENFMYFVSYPDNWLLIVIVRTFFSAVMHAMAQATFGGFIGFGKFKPAILKFILIPTGYFAAVFLHFAWNLTVSFEETALAGFFFMFSYLIALLAIFQIALYLESRTVLRELTEEASSGLFPQEHLRFIPFVTKKYKYGWCPQFVNQKEYVKTAVMLGLRKFQMKNTSGFSRRKYETDVENLRYMIKRMFYDATLKYQQNDNNRPY